jgi:putative AbiEi antitoxin of type IV toxin-antitoxin system
MPRKSIYDADRLGRIAREQFGVIGRNQALDCGVSRSAVAYRLRQDGQWRKVIPGVYATTTGDMSPDARAMAALLHAGPRGVITGAVAVRRHNLRCAGLNEVDVLVPSGTRVQSAGFVRIIHTSRMPETFYTTRRIRYAPPARAVADAARGMGRLGDVRAVVAEAVQNGRCDLAALITELNAGPSTGSRALRMALGEVGDGIRSAAEADLKTLIERSDLERPIYNATLYTTDGTFLGIADAWWERAGVVGEVDSRQYHLSPEDYERTTARHNHMTAHGINVLHFLPSMLKRQSPTVIADLRGAITRGNSRPPLPIITKPASA